MLNTIISLWIVFFCLVFISFSIVTLHRQGFDQSPRISNVSDVLKLPGLSSLPLSPALLSSPETERGGFSCTSNYGVPISHRKQWEIPLLSESSSTMTFPDPPPVPQRKHWEIPLLSKAIAPSVPPPPPLPQQKRRHWEMPVSSTPVLRPPELVPPSRPSVLQNTTTSECLGENGETFKPKLKPLHWVKVRTSSDHEMVWDQFNSSSFKLNEEMIETLFVVNKSNQKSKDAASCSVLPPPNQEDRVLDPKKSQNIAILLKALNVTTEEVCESLLEGSTDTLGTELLESLLKMAPSKEEERKLKEHKDDSPTKLDVAEKFLKADGKTTLLHFVVQEIIRTEGARFSGTDKTTSSTLTEDAKCRRLGLQVVSNLSSELGNVKRAATMDFEVLRSDALKLSKGIANVADIVQLNQKAGSYESSKKFTEAMSKFIGRAEEEILKAQAQGKVALSLVKEITEYFHGNLAKEEAHPFRIFLVVRDFLAVLDRVCKEVGLINERTMVSSAHKFPVPVNPMLPQPHHGLQGRQQCSNSSDDDNPLSP